MVRTRRLALVLAVLVAGLVGTGIAVSRSAVVGEQPDGSYLVPTGQALTPEGVHIEVSDPPLGMVLRPDGAGHRE